MKFRNKGALGPALLFLAILIVAVNALFAFHSIEVLVAGQTWVEHTWEVVGQVKAVMSAAKDAGDGNLHYLLSDGNAFPEHVATASGTLYKQIDHLQALTADNPVQQKNIAEMRRILTQRFALVQQEIEVRKTGPLPIERALVLNAMGNPEMDQLRLLTDRMEGEERRLLVIRRAVTRDSNIRARATVGVASLLDFLLIVMMFRYFTRERDLRIAAEENARSLALSRIEVEKGAEEVRLLNRTLEERVQLRTAELEATNRELEAFSYSVSHDLRAPLRTIDGFSLALEEDYAETVGATGKDYIRRVRTGVQRMGELIDALLQLSRITRAPIAREHFDLTALVRSVVADLQQANADRSITFQVEDGMEADGDPKLIRVALENLLGNAAKFSGKVTEAVVECGWDPAQEAWFVRDNGAGFDMHYAGKLFNAFNRLHGDKDFKGSGIGLATVARVIRRHHGKIWADSIIERGATFWFTLG